MATPKRNHEKKVQLGQGGRHAAKGKTGETVAEAAVVGGAGAAVGGIAYGDANMIKGGYHTGRAAYHDVKHSKSGKAYRQHLDTITSRPNATARDIRKDELLQYHKANSRRHYAKFDKQMGKADKAFTRGRNGYIVALGGMGLMYAGDYYLRNRNGKQERVHKPKR